MMRTIALLFFFAAPGLGLYTPNLRVRFELTVFGYGSTAFIELPQSNTSAAASGWVQKTRPEGPEGLSSLVLWCPSDDYTICVLCDDTGYIAGMQIALDQEKISNAVYDWQVQGYTNWTTTLNNTTKNYYTVQQYYISSETLATDQAKRMAARDSSLLLQDDNLWVSGFNGNLYNISTIADYVTGDDSIYTKQQCVPGMGNHYYYNMTTSTECTGEALFPWFPLIYDGQLIGVGFNVFANYTVDDGSKNWFEYSGEAIVRNTIPNGPECLYDLVGDVGSVTLHTYFIDKPFLVTCLW